MQLHLDEIANQNHSWRSRHSPPRSSRVAWRQGPQGSKQHLALAGPTTRAPSFVTPLRREKRSHYCVQYGTSSQGLHLLIEPSSYPDLEFPAESLGTVHGRSAIQAEVARSRAGHPVR